MNIERPARVPKKRIERTTAGKESDMESSSERRERGYLDEGADNVRGGVLVGLVSVIAGLVVVACQSLVG